MASSAIRWLVAAWRSPRQREAVARAYLGLRTQPLLLADIALRGSVFQPTGLTDPIAIAKNEGRRELALEIINLAKTDPASLFAQLDAQTPKDRTP